MFRLLHISDLHFSVPSGVAEFADLLLEGSAHRVGVSLPQSMIDRRFGRHSNDLAIVAADYIQRNFKDYDAILISGDLATRGRPQDLRAARNYILEPSIEGTGYFTSSGNATLCTNNRPILLMPGNHDRFRGYTGLAGSKSFESVFQDWQFAENSVFARFVTGSLGKEISFVMADFTLESNAEARPPGYPACLGQGLSRQSTIDRMVTATTKIQRNRPARGVIWVTHFPPNGSSFKADPNLELLDSHILVDAAQRSNVSYILSGHIHQFNIHMVADASVITAGAPIILSENCDKSFNALEFDVVDGSVVLSSLCKHEWSASRSNFVANKIEIPSR